jgi:hypothetical protein
VVLKKKSILLIPKQPLPLTAMTLLYQYLESIHPRIYKAISVHTPTLKERKIQILNITAEPLDISHYSQIPHEPKNVGFLFGE